VSGLQHPRFFHDDHDADARAARPSADARRRTGDTHRIQPGRHAGRAWGRSLPPDRIAAWRSQGALPFFHYAYNEERLLNVSFYDDSLGHDAFGAAFDQPTLIFQGLRDESVDHRTVEAFARTRPNATLSLLEDDHQLIASLPRIWHDVQAFLELVD
jgi:hypothetical protein